jgi:sec-independent protein translocase protein TatA
MPFGVGPLEILILLLVALLVFGPKRLPEMGRSLGRGMREFKDSISGKDDEPLTTTEFAAPAEPPPPAELPPAELPPAEPTETAAAPQERETTP